MVPVDIFQVWPTDVWPAQRPLSIFCPPDLASYRRHPGVVEENKCVRFALPSNMFSKKSEKNRAAPANGSDNDDPMTYKSGNVDGLHRRLNNRQIQLIAIGGTIGTGLFVSIGAGLAKGGPGNLLVCYILYSCVVALVNNSIAEMSTYMPVSGGFIRLAGAWVDDALGFMVGWNFFLYEALLIPFEVVALNLVLSFWNDKVTEPGPTAGICAAVIISYG